jgi:2-aminoadipate transaminase
MVSSNQEEQMRQHVSNRQPMPLLNAVMHTLIQLDRSSSQPLYRQICESLREAILSGRLSEGTRLPTERALAQELGVNRTTVMNAYNELASEGLIEGHVGRGTTVKRSYLSAEDDLLEQDMPSWLFGLAEGEEIILGADARVLGEIAGQDTQREIISLAAGSPAFDLLPTKQVQRIIASGLAGAQQNALGYSPVEGLPELRRGIAGRMRKRGVAIDAQHILILSGSTQGIGLIARFLLNPGDEVVVEVPTYLGAIQAFRALGARVIGVPMDHDGMRVDLLESILARRTPRFIYTLPTFHNPTGAVLSLERRKRLLQLARRHQIPILEDDPYGEVYFGEKVPQPLKALDTQGQVLYVSTFSKILAPGLRVAWLAAPEPVIERFALHKQVFDLNTNAISQWLISEFIQRDLLDSHLENLRQQYHRKRDLMLKAIACYWPEGSRISHPQGGFNLWCRLPGDMRARSLQREAALERVSFVIGEPFHVDGGGHQYIRLNFTSPSERHIEEGIERIGTAMRRIQERRLPREEREVMQRMPMV